MRTTDLAFTEEDLAAVTSASRQLRARYRDFAEYEDIQQELYCFLIQNYSKMDAYRKEYDAKYAERLIAKSLRNAGDRYCRKEKAAKSGYSPDDEFFYSIPMVADILQLHFDPDWMAPSVQVGVETGGGKPPNEGGNLMAMVADVGRAYGGLNKYDQALLGRIYGANQYIREAIALEALNWGITHNAADHRIRRVLGRLRVALGGPRPYEEE